MRLLAIVLVGFLCAPVAAQRRPDRRPAGQAAGEDRFEVLNLEGWTVYINRTETISLNGQVGGTSVGSIDIIGAGSPITVTTQ